MLWDLARMAQPRGFYLNRVWPVLPVLLLLLVVGRFADIIDRTLLYTVFIGWAIAGYQTQRLYPLRSLNQERTQGTLALLLTTSLYPLEIVSAKFLAHLGTQILPSLILTPLAPLLAWCFQLRPEEWLAYLLWSYSFNALTSLVWVLLGTTRLDQKNLQGAGGIIIATWFGIWIGNKLTSGAYFSILVWLNPMLAFRMGNLEWLYFSGAAALNLVWIGPGLWFAAWCLQRDVYPVRGKISFRMLKLAKTIRRVTPGRRLAERWLLQHFPLAWIGVRTQAWMALLAFITLLATGFVAIAFHTEEAWISFFYIIFAFLLIAHVAGYITRSIQQERETRMVELLQVIPLAPREVIWNRLVECSFWIVPPFLVMALSCCVMTIWVGGWLMIALTALTLVEALCLAAMTCIGTHLGTLLPRSWFVGEQWLIVGPLVIILGLFAASAWASLGVESMGLWFATSTVRIAVDLVLIGRLFRSLEKRLSVQSNF